MFDAHQTPFYGVVNLNRSKETRLVVDMYSDNATIPRLHDRMVTKGRGKALTNVEHGKPRELRVYCNAIAYTRVYTRGCEARNCGSRNLRLR